MALIGCFLSIINLNIDGFNHSIKWYRLGDRKK
jgi:hypothetical protein